MNQGIYDMPRAAYHAGDLIDGKTGELVYDAPALSNSIAHLLVSRSPLHAWTAHPKLNPDFEEETSDVFDLGTVVHDLLLEGSDIAQVVEADSWRTNAAKEARDAARASGKVPLLPKQYERAMAMVDAVDQQLEVHGAEPRPFENGQAEATLVWEELHGVVCKARVDYLQAEVIDDLKTSGVSASPAVFARNLYTHGFDVQAAFYIRGFQAVRGFTPRFRWVVVETSPPYALSVIEPTAAVLQVAGEKVEMALDIWRQCLESGEWPGYPAWTQFAELPDWELTRWLERQGTEAE